MGDLVTKESTELARASKKLTSQTFQENTTNIAGLIYQAASNNKLGTQDSFDFGKRMVESEKTKDGMKNMIAAQMLSIHTLQQDAVLVQDVANKSYFTNSAIKLSNAFSNLVQSAIKLESGGTQKIIVEKVYVHDGGQVVVGNIQTSK